MVWSGLRGSASLGRLSPADRRVRQLGIAPIHGPLPQGVRMAETPFNVYVIQGRSPRDFSDCQAALANVPAHLESIPFTRQEDEIIERTSDAAALIVSSSPMTRRVMSALK